MADDRQYEWAKKKYGDLSRERFEEFKKTSKFQRDWNLYVQTNTDKAVRERVEEVRALGVPGDQAFEFINATDTYEKDLEEARIGLGRELTSADRSRVARALVDRGFLEGPRPNLDKQEADKAALADRMRRGRTPGKPQTLLASPDAFGSSAVSTLGRRVKFG